MSQKYKNILEKNLINTEYNDSPLKLCIIYIYKRCSCINRK